MSLSVPRDVAPRPATEHIGYATDLILVDGLSVGAVLVGGGALLLCFIATVDFGDGDKGDNHAACTVGFVLVGVGAAGYAVGAPIVHLVRDNPLSAALSLGLRLGLPVLGAAIASDGYTPLPWIGVASAMVIDWWFLAEVEVQREGVAGLRPTLYYDGHAAGLGVQGAF